MIMQANFTRCGQPISMRVDKFDYLFTENQYGDFVARVSSDDHAKRMIETGNFKEYETPTAEELQDREIAAFNANVKAEAETAAAVALAEKNRADFIAQKKAYKENRMKKDALELSEYGLVALNPDGSLTEEAKALFNPDGRFTKEAEDWYRECRAKDRADAVAELEKEAKAKGKGKGKK